MPGGHYCESMEEKGLGRDAARYPGSGADLSANAKKRASTLIRSAPHLV